MINNALGDRDVVLIGDAATRTVRAYGAGGRDFTATDAPDRVVVAGETWRVEEETLVGAGGERVPRLPGYIAYWFTWSGFKAGAPLYGD